MDGLKNDEERVEAWWSSWKISLVGMAVVDKDFNFVSVNNQWLRMLGVPATEFYGSRFTDITPRKIASAESEQAELVRQGMIDSYLMHKEYQFSDGSSKKVTLLVTRVPLDTRKPFGYFLSRIVLRENFLTTGSLGKNKDATTSNQTMFVSILSFFSRYWVWIATATAVLTGLANEFFQMGFF